MVLISWCDQGHCVIEIDFRNCLGGTFEGKK